MGGSIISTDNAKCRDCYRCVRVCPVKAIRISDGQARVEAERCIVCGTCVRECPQKAKHVRDDLEHVRNILSGSELAIASIAPSFPAAFPEYGGGLLASALKKIGFSKVTETAVGAEFVAFATADLMESNSEYGWITSACPVVVNLIKKYHPNAIGKITPLISPMVAHSRYLKSKYGNTTKTVFIGPCSAKKGEADDDPLKSVDAVLTFEELRELLQDYNIDRASLKPATFDDVRPNKAHLFPLEGGLAETASISSELISESFAALSGPDNVLQMIDNALADTPIKLFEALFCTGGCVNGACFGSQSDFFTRKSRILQYHKRGAFEPDEVLDPDVVRTIDMKSTIEEQHIEQIDFSEADIRKVMLDMGKRGPDDELNCGACGYGSCRENAIAVLSGMAERNMCLPWMRQLAERKTDQIIDYSPNGIVMVGPDFNIVSFNPAFADMFSCSEAIIGRPIGALMDPDDFETVAAGIVDRISGKSVAFPQYDLLTIASIYRLQNENTLIGIYSRASTTKEEEDRIARMRAETLENAQQVISKQMRMAQEIASILGETTSETRVLLRKLTELAQERDTPEGHK